jgi:serine/threonine-protein kinase Chk1
MLLSFSFCSYSVAYSQPLQTGRILPSQSVVFDHRRYASSQPARNNERASDSSLGARIAISWQDEALELSQPVSKRYEGALIDPVDTITAQRDPNKQGQILTLYPPSPIQTTQLTEATFLEVFSSERLTRFFSETDPDRIIDALDDAMVSNLVAHTVHNSSQKVKKSSVYDTL